MKRSLPLVCLLTIYLLASLHSALAQDYMTATGNPQFATNYPVENGFINLANGNLHLEIPLATLKQRGALSLNEKLVYDSRIWMIGHYSNSYWWPNNIPNTPNTQGGWRFVSGAETGSISYAYYSGYSEDIQCPEPPYNSVHTVTVETPSWSDPSGAVHTFNASVTTDQNDCGGLYTQSVQGGPAIDGSGYFISDDGSGNPIITGKDGNEVYPEVKDRYGNYWSNDSNGNLIDDLGRTPVIVTKSGNVTYYDVLSPNGPINNNGTRVRYTVTVAPIQVKTNFQKSGVREWPDSSGYGTLYPVQSIQLPNGTSYQFTYDSYGEMTSVTLPTGGIVHYGWSNYFDACQNGNRWLTSRSLGNDPATTFTPSPMVQCSANYLNRVILHKPSGDETEYEFALNNGAWASTIFAYDGPVSRGKHLSWIENGYDFSHACDNVICQGAMYIKLTSSQTRLWSNGFMSRTEYYYTDPSLGKVSDIKMWDYHDPSTFSFTTQPPEREAKYEYTGADLTKVTTLSLNTPVGETDYEYTNSSITTSGVPHHDSSLLWKPYLYKVTQSLNTDPSHSPVTTYTMDDTGMVRSISDPKGNVSSINYQCSNALPNQATNALNQVTTYGYDCNSGAITSVKDPNDLAAGRAGTTYQYEGTAGRVQTINYPDGGQTSYSYPSATEVDKSVLATPDPTITSQDISDAFGRPYQHIQAGISTETTYDTNGRQYCVTNPHTGSTAPTDGSTCMTTYDGLDRPKVQTLPDGSTLQWSYSGNTVTSTDEAGNSWTRTSNAFGQLTDVVEPGNLRTSYVYDGLGNLATVTQAGVQTRTFVYDSLSRLVTLKTPEAGLICYGVWSGGNCVNGYDADGNLVAKTDARGITISYSYDSLNRLTGKSYSDGTPASSFTYDNFTGWGQPHGAAIGRLVRAYTCTPAGCEDDLYSYDPMGRINHIEGATPSEAGHASHWIPISYDLAGNMTDLTYPNGHHIKQGWDSSGHLTSSQLVDVNGTSFNQNYLQSASYFPDGSPQVMTLGNGAQQIIDKNSRLQVQKLVISSPLPPFNSQPFVSHTYCYVNCTTGGTANNGDIWGITDTLNSAKTQGFTYDALSRITGFSINGATNQQFAIDAFGNLSPKSGSNPIYNFDPASNKINNLPCAASLNPYDGSGNQTCDTDANGAARKYVFDAEGRVTSIAMSGSGTPFETYIYDAGGNRVRKDNADGSYTEYVYFNGQPMAEKDQNGDWTDYIYANGKKIASVPSTELRIHAHGNNTVGTFTAMGFPLSQTIQSGDHLAWRQYDAGSNVDAGIYLGFTDGSTTLQQVADNHGQLAESGGIIGAWGLRVVDLSAFAGKTVNEFALMSGWNSLGRWDVWYADIALYRADGSVTQLFNSQPIPMNSLYVSDPSAQTEGQICLEQGSSCVTSSTVQPTDSRTAAVHYYLSDHIGSTQMEFSRGGWPVWKGEYTPFGQELDNQDTVNQYKFAGMEHDPESGLDHTQFRQYASVTGRWLSPDPYNGSYDLSNPQSFNRYSYVLNNPLRFVDPTGLECTTSDGYVYFDYELGGDGSATAQSICAQMGGEYETPYSYNVGGPSPNNSDNSSSDSTVIIYLPSPGSGGDNSGAGSSSGAGQSSAPNNTTPLISDKQKACVAEAFSKNAVSLGLDVVGTVTPGGGVVGLLAQTGLGIGSIAHSALSGDSSATGMVGLGASFVNLQTGVVRASASYALRGTEMGLARTLAKSLPGVGQIANGLAFGADAYTAYKDYQACMAR